jgi:hypothetical protein
MLLDNGMSRALLKNDPDHLTDILSQVLVSAEELIVAKQL